MLFVLTGRHEIYISSWYAFKRMEFLIDRDEPRPTFDSVEVSNSENNRSKFVTVFNNNNSTIFRKGYGLRIRLFTLVHKELAKIVANIFCISGDHVCTPTRKK